MSEERSLRWDEETRRRVRHNDPTLIYLRLVVKSIEKNRTSDIAESLCRNVFLTYLDLRANDLGDDGAVLFANALRQNTTLATIHLGENAIGKVGAVTIASALHRNTSLSVLGLEGNNFGDVGAVDIAAALRCNKTLSTLFMGGNRIGIVGAAAIADSLRQNCSLSVLHLWGNVIGNSGASDIARALPQNTTLTHLDLARTGIGDKGAAHIATALLRNRTLTTILLWGNEIGARCSGDFAEVLRRNNTLTHLDLGGNNFGDVGAAVIAGGLRQNTSLVFLDLRANKVGDVGWRAFADALRHNSTITFLGLNDSADCFDHVVELRESRIQVLQLLERNKGIDDRMLSHPYVIATDNSASEVSSFTNVSKRVGSVGRIVTNSELPSASCLLSVGDDQPATDLDGDEDLCGNSFVEIVDHNVETGSVADNELASLRQIHSGSRSEAYYFGEEDIERQTRCEQSTSTSVETGTPHIYKMEGESFAGLRQSWGHQTEDGTTIPSSHDTFSLPAIMEADGRSLLERIRDDHSTVASVNFCGKTVGDRGAEYLAAALRHNSNVRELRLDNAHIGDKGMASLAAVLPLNSTVSKIYLRRNQITDTGVAALAEALRLNFSVNFITLVENRVGCKGATVIANTLRTNTTIKELELDKNSIGLEGAMEIASSLRFNASLRVLKLDYCGIGTRGAKAIAEALHYNETLTKLYLRGNKISKDGAELFGEVIRFNETLTRLDLSCNGIDSDQLLAKLERLLVRNKTSASSAAKSKKGKLWTPAERNRICVLFSDPLVWRDNGGKLHPITAKLNLRDERRVLSRCVREAEGAIQLTFDVATSDRLQEVAVARYGCLHFSGHGLPGDLGNSHLIFEDRRGGAHFVSREEVSRLLCSREPFKVVFVSACHSLPIGQAFIEAGARHVVCCEQESELNDNAAREFTLAFYRSLVKGLTVQSAFDSGKGAVSAWHGHDEADKFVLIPANQAHDHDVPVFDTKCQVCKEKKGFVGGPSIPATPAHFIGRELVMYSVLNALLTERLVTVVGPRGSGLSSLASSVCHYVSERLRTILNIESILFVHRNRTASNLSSSLLAPLIEQLVAEGKAKNKPGKGLLEEVVCDALKEISALVVFDDIRGLESELSNFLHVLFEKVSSVTVLLIAGKRTGFLSQSVVEEVVVLDPLPVENAADLFIKRCPHAVRKEEKTRLRDFFWSEASDRLAEEVSEDIRPVVQAVIEGVPSVIIDIAKTMSEDLYKGLLDLCS